MSLRGKAALLLCLLAGALYSGAEALRSVRPPANAQLPKELYERFAVRADAAEYVLRDSGKYVAVFEKASSREPARRKRILCTGRATIITADRGLEKTERVKIRRKLA